MNWLRTIINALHYEPENWGAYIHGQQSQLILSKINAKPKYTGLALRLAAHVSKVLRFVRLQVAADEKKSVDVFVFAETVNQATTLSTTVSQLDKNGVSIHRVTGHGAASVSGEFKRNDCEWITLSPIDAMKVAFLMIIRGPIIWRDLANKDQKLRQWYFDEFFRYHIYLVYFEKALSARKPKLILMSNDHNAAQRCMLALARVKDIKTAYMQHASVSRIFPALVFDYNLLDGQVARDTYVACSPNKPMNAPVPAQRHVFLTGQKKPVPRVRHIPSSTVGLAMKISDDVQDVIKVVAAISEAGHLLRLRWHPAMGPTKVEEIRQAFTANSSVTLSEPVVESVGDFLAQLGVLVASNSSIHLEAAVAGVMPIYFEISHVSTSDYYGYVNNGVSAEAKDMNGLLSLIGDVLAGHRKLDPVAVQGYSATFGTEWEGLEGELAAGIIKELLGGVDPAECWGYEGEVGEVKSQQVGA